MFERPDEWELNASLAFKKAFLDAARASAILTKSPLRQSSAIVVYVYCEISDRFYVVYGKNGDIQYGKVQVSNGHLLNAELFRLLYIRYRKTFIDIREDINEYLGEAELDDVVNLWKELYSIFIYPWTQLYPENTRFFTRLNYDIEALPCIIDFNELYNFKYRLSVHSRNDLIFFTTVTTSQMETFIRNVVNLPFPKLESIVMLYGFKQFDRQEVLNACKTTNRKDAAILREKIFQHVFSIIRRAGGNLIFLNDLTDLENLFIAGGSFRFIQLLSHYHEERLFTRSEKSISFKRLKQMIDRLKSTGNLRDDICIDAITCTNFTRFRELYDMGLKYIYLSHHKISTDLAAYMIYELYTGVNARSLGWDFPYLDGKSYMQDAWAKISRCFYTKMAQGNLIQIL